MMNWKLALILIIAGLTLCATFEVSFNSEFGKLSWEGSGEADTSLDRVLDKVDKILPE